MPPYRNADDPDGTLWRLCHDLRREFRNQNLGGKAVDNHALPARICNRLESRRILSTNPEQRPVNRFDASPWQKENGRRQIRHAFKTTSDARCADTIRAVYSAPTTKRKSGPKLIADAGPMKCSPDTGASKTVFSLGAVSRRRIAPRKLEARKSRRSTLIT